MTLEYSYWTLDELFGKVGNLVFVRNSILFHTSILKKKKERRKKKEIEKEEERMKEKKERKNMQWTENPYNCGNNQFFFCIPAQKTSGKNGFKSRKLQGHSCKVKIIEIKFIVNVFIFLLFLIFKFQFYPTLTISRMYALFE